MAQTSIVAMLTSDAMLGKKEDVTDVMYHLWPSATPLLQRVGMNGFTATNTSHQYAEISERPMRTTLYTTISNSDTTIKLYGKVAPSGARIQIGNEVILLGTSDGASDSTYTGCTRTVGTAAAAAANAGEMVTILGKPRVQGAAAGSTPDAYEEPNIVTAYSGIYTAEIMVTGTAAEMQQYGVASAKYEDIMNRQMVYLKKQVENCLLWGVATAPTSSVAGSFDGVYERVGATNYTDLSGLAATQANMRTAIRTIRDYGGLQSGGVVCCSLYMADVFDSWGQNYVQTGANTSVTYGINVKQLLMGGVTLDILPMDNIGEHVFILDPSRVKVGPLGSRSFKHTYYGPDGDRVKGAIVGEYTAEIPNIYAHYILTGVKYSD